MPGVWVALKKSLDCKSPSDVNSPKSTNPCSSLCSTSIKDVIHGSKGKKSRPPPPPPNGSPRSVESNIVFNCITHEAILNECTSELDTITEHDGGATSSSAKPRNPTAPPRRSIVDYPIFGDGVVDGCSQAKDYVRVNVRGSATWVCQRCGEVLRELDAVEAHHFSKHAVSELVQGDSSRNIVEIICQTSSMTPQNNGIHIETVLKIHNMQKNLSKFEEYRETVKTKASKLPKKHPRCIADGNELLRFFGTTLSCSLGINGTTSLCSSETCGVCRILRNGFSIKSRNLIGVFTTSTCGKAVEAIEINEEDEKNPTTRKALIVCRAIAGRIHKPLLDYQEMGSKHGFDSLAGNVDRCCNIEELYLLNPKALLPCFVVIIRNF